MRHSFYELHFAGVRPIRKIALSSRKACFFLRFELEAASLSFIERRLSICLHRRIIRPMSYWPILPTPLVGEYHVKGRVNGNCTNRTICLSFAELFLRLVNP